MMDFSSLMATHFDVLSKDAGDCTLQKDHTKAIANSVAPKAVEPELQHRGGGSSVQPTVIDDPEVQQVFMDPEVQLLLTQLRAGRPLELHEIGRNNPRLLTKVKVLLDKGLLSMQH